MRHVLLLSFVAVAMSSVLASSAMADAVKCKDTAVDKLPLCSYVATNGNCEVTIDRMNPATPPTIYVKRGCSVKVVVTNPSGLETLTLDWKSSAIVVPPDTFQTAFSALSTNLGKFTDVQKSGPRLENAQQPRCDMPQVSCTDASDISNSQMEVLIDIQAMDPIKLSSDTLGEIKVALLPIPGGAGLVAQPWHDTDTWRNRIMMSLDKALVRVNDPGQVEALDRRVLALATSIATYKKKAGDKPELLAKADTLDRNQELVKAAFAALFSDASKIAALRTAIKGLDTTPTGIVGSSTITDQSPSTNRNYQSQTWTVDYVNKLSTVAKRVAADKLTDATTANLTTLADMPAKQPIATVTVQFQSPSRIEVSTGLLVPFTPYHSYAKASVAANGTITDNVVQESKTFTVVPMAFINILQKEWISQNLQRSGFFYTGGVGYNPATSMVEFGAGLTYSYRSMAISFLADIGRDTKLAGGFTVGQSLGNTSNAATPLSMTHWTVKPAMAISVRIPLAGGASK
jgi:hypothetical protein